MPSLFDTLHKDDPNPLDNIEDILHANDWSFNRLSDTELTVNVQGRCCSYDVIFLWQSDMAALQLCLQYDFKVHPLNLPKAAKMLMTINERTWMGHFEVSADTCYPNYRYTTLLNPRNRHSYEQLENIVDIALAQCETNFTAFSLLASEETANDDTLPLALMETKGIS